MGQFQGYGIGSAIGERVGQGGKEGGREEEREEKKIQSSRETKPKINQQHDDDSTFSFQQRR